MAALAVAAGLIVTTAGGCGKKIEEPTEAKAAKIGVVYTTTGLGDNNFNDMVNSGMEKAKAELNITYDYSEPSSMVRWLPCSVSSHRQGNTIWCWH